MVFRQLPIGSSMALCRLSLVVAAFVGSACGETAPPSSASIEMEVDNFSCFADAEGLLLSCTSTAIVTVLDERGETIAGDCATLPAGRLIDSAQVIQDTLSLGSLPSGTPLTISLSIHSGVLSPCPQANATSDAFLSGSTPLVTLAEQSSGILLLLRCSGPTTGEPTNPTTGECTDCDNNLQTCILSNGLSNCESLINNCAMSCLDAPDIDRCFLSCEQLESFCTNGAGGVVLQCEGDANSCFDECTEDVPPDFCGEACADAAIQCTTYQQLQSQCNEDHMGCLSDCGGSTSCLSLGF
jgi:hypothetical protein